MLSLEASRLEQVIAYQIPQLLLESASLVHYYYYFGFFRKYAVLFPGPTIFVNVVHLRVVPDVVENRLRMTALPSLGQGTHAASSSDRRELQASRMH